MPMDKFSVLLGFAEVFFKKRRYGDFIKAQIFNIQLQKFSPIVSDKLTHVVGAIRITACGIHKDRIFCRLEFRISMVAQRCWLSTTMEVSCPDHASPLCLSLALYIKRRADFKNWSAFLCKKPTFGS
jgi:hypothetical protein